MSTGEDTDSFASTTGGVGTQKVNATNNSGEVTNGLQVKCLGTAGAA